MKYVVDSYAWIEYFKESKEGIGFGKIIDDVENEIFSSIITIAEVCSVFKRENRNPDMAYTSILDLSEIYFLNPELSKEAGIVHAEIRKKIKDFGLADAFILLTARKLGAKILTGDPHFKGLKKRF